MNKMKIIFSLVIAFTYACNITVFAQSDEESDKQKKEQYQRELEERRQRDFQIEQSHSRQFAQPRRPFYKGLADFKAKQTFKLKYGIEDGHVYRSDVNPQDSTRSQKTTEYKNEMYLKIAAELPAGTVFRIDSASSGIRIGDLEVELAFKDEISEQDLLSLNGVIEVKEYYFLSAPREIEPIPIPKELISSLPDGWNKETGYQKIISLFDAGEDLVLVSAVFSNPNNEQKYWIHTPFTPVIQTLKYGEKGKTYGMSYDKNGLAWWTQEISVDQIHELYESDIVINLVPRTQ